MGCGSTACGHVCAPSAEWWGTLAGSTWTLGGRRTVRNPAGQMPLVRRRTGQVTIQTGQQGSANNAIWNYLYADSLASCTTLSNSVTIDPRAVYAVTDYSESNSADMWGPVIARQLFISNNTHNHYVPFGTLLPGMPATYEEVTVLAPVSGGFGE